MPATFAGLKLDRPHIMGIVNVTPDSFSDGGRHDTTSAAVAHALQLEADGATILDIGGESTRPGSEIVPVENELDRVIPVIRELVTRITPATRISIDTRKAQVMRAAVEAGAHIVNDVSALTFDPDALVTSAELKIPVVLMHAQGDPKTMQDNPQYQDVVAEVGAYLAERARACREVGISASDICVDPGIGFGKTLDHNITLMKNLRQFHDLGYPVLLGASRKRFIGALTKQDMADQRVASSVAAALVGLERNVQLFRVHDVRETADAFSIWSAICPVEK